MSIRSDFQFIHPLVNRRDENAAPGRARRVPPVSLGTQNPSVLSLLTVLERWWDPALARARIVGAWQTQSVTRTTYTVGRLDAATWGAFADLVERNNGIYGGCWCAPNHVEYQRGVSDPRTLKEALVRCGRAHAALVFDDESRAQGWCQYGPSDSLDLKHGREYRKNPPAPARWRVACIFVDKRHRGEGIARLALEGAIAQIILSGGGRIEAVAETTVGRQAQDRFLFCATVELFEDLGFTRDRQVGKHAWVVSRTVSPASTATPSTHSGHA
ncbi:MAG: hypothetical protein B7X07_01255 [Actinobacteria bacterium 21-64-8]|nr:MAG: hypothetical protein B7X07_01255 [Actinobacteria bacterium 21-64-8]